jgi:hypothetical protein
MAIDITINMGVVPAGGAQFSYRFASAPASDSVDEQLAAPGRDPGDEVVEFGSRVLGSGVWLPGSGLVGSLPSKPTYTDVGPDERRLIR